MEILIKGVPAFERNEIKQTRTFIQWLLNWIFFKRALVEMYQYNVMITLDQKIPVGAMVLMHVPYIHSTKLLTLRAVDRLHPNWIKMVSMPTPDWFSYAHFQQATYVIIGKQFGESTTGSIDSGEIR